MFIFVSVLNAFLYIHIHTILHHFIVSCFENSAYIELNDLLLKLEKKFGKRIEYASNGPAVRPTDIELVSPELVPSWVSSLNFKVTMKIPKGYVSCIQCQGNSSTCLLCKGTHLMLKTDVARILGRS